MDIEKILRPGASVYIVGIKGTGASALAELMHGRGIKVSGSDTGEVFYTDAILRGLGIGYYESFDAAHIRDDFDLVVHSAAYSAGTNCELAEARRRGFPVVNYPEALGAWSAGFDSSGIAGVHGKTTTTAMTGAMMKGAGLPAQILAGSAVTNFNGRSTLTLGNKYFIAETCEYRKHFLNFHPARIIVTSVESDHQDFFPSRESIRDAFAEYCRLLPRGGELIYCADDPGASEVAGIIEKENRGITFVPYGFTAPGASPLVPPLAYQIRSYTVLDGQARFSIAGFPKELILRVPGRHQALNAAAALALTSILVKKEFGKPGCGDSGWNEERLEGVKKALEEFRGSKRRSEIIGEAGGILFMDDYGHHPSAIKTTLEGLKDFYPSRRLVVSFMSHTYSRTAALLDDFAASLSGADVLFLHKIYASAREQYSGGISGKSLYEKVLDLRNAAGGREVIYIDEPMDAFETAKKILRGGDLFITIGAGNNWSLGIELFDFFKTHNGSIQ